MGFPTAMGLPAVYDLNNPTIVSIGGEVKAKFNPNPDVYKRQGYNRESLGVSQEIG